MRTEHPAVFRTPSPTEPALAGVVQRLVALYHPERVYLFGSVARGDANPDSDYDLMIVVPESAPEQLRSEDLGLAALRGSGVGADILVWTQRDFERQLHLKASLPSTVIREGMVLYSAA